MNKVEKTKLKKKAKRLVWMCYLMAFGTIGIFILLMSIQPIGDFLHEGFNNDNFGIQILSVIAVVLPMTTLLFGLLIVGMKATWVLQIFHKYKKDLYEKQNKLHMKFFWEAVTREDYDEAKRLYNIEGFIWGSERVLCNGILMGIATQLPIDVDWSENVYDRMKSYL